MNNIKLRGYLQIASLVLSSLFYSCSDDSVEDEPYNPQMSEIAGTWQGTVYYDDGTDDGTIVKVVLSDDGVYRDYLNGNLVGTGYFYYDGTTISIPDECAIANDWGAYFTVNLSGSSMSWTNSAMNSFGAEYRFTKRESSGGNQGGGNQGDEKPDYSKIVKQNTSVSSSCQDYYIELRIKHTLEDVIPETVFDYEVAHGFDGESQAWMIDYPRSPIEESVTSEGKATVAVLRYPFFYYFMAKVSQTQNTSDESYYKEILAECEMYLSSYSALRDKEKSGEKLSSDERSLKADLTKELNKYQNMMKADYKAWVYIKINGIRYLCATIDF